MIPASRAGYALPVVLAALAVAALVLLAAIPAVGDFGRAARLARQEAEFARAAADAEAWVGYLAATGQPARDRLHLAPDAPGAAVRLDGRAYGWRGMTLALQDEAGLLDLNSAEDRALRRLFAHGGAAPGEADILADQLLDYRDGDDLRRRAGAERRDYAAAGLPPPPDGLLADPAQVLGLARMAAHPGLWNRVADLVAASPRKTEVNLDTAPFEVLEIGLGLSPTAAAAIIRDRQARPFYGAVRPAMDPAQPTARLRLTLRDPQGRAHRAVLTLSPRDPEQPVRITRSHRPEDLRIKAHAPFPDLRR